MSIYLQVISVLISYERGLAGRAGLCHEFMTMNDALRNKIAFEAPALPGIMAMSTAKNAAAAIAATAAAGLPA